MRFNRQRDTDEPEINLVPLIDVLLVLLIFLTATTTFARLSTLGIQLPASGTEAPPPVAEIVVEVDADGRLAVDGRPLTGSAVGLDAALRLARQGYTEPPLLVIHADAQASHQSVIDVMQAAGRAGLERLSFAARQPVR